MSSGVLNSCSLLKLKIKYRTTSFKVQKELNIGIGNGQCEPVKIIDCEISLIMNLWR